MSKVAAFIGANSGPILGVGVFAVGALGAGAYLGLLTPEGTQQQVVPTEVALPAPDAPPTEETNVEPVVVAPTVSEAAPESETETVVLEEPTVEPVPEPVIEDAIEVEPEAETETAVLLPRAPSIDEVRSEADGLTVIAGRGEPDADIILFVDNVENTTVQVGRDSAFAIVTFLDVSPNATVLSVVQRVGDVELVASDIILAPRVVAQAAPEPTVDDESVEADTAANTADEITETASATPDADVVDETIAQVVTTDDDSIAGTSSDATANIANVPDEATAGEAIVTAAETVVESTTDAVIASGATAIENQGEAVAVLVDPIAPNPDGTEADAIAPVQSEDGSTNAASSTVEDASPTPTTQDTVDADTAPNPEPTTEVAILKSDEEGVQIINRSSAPEVMSNVEIDTISYSDEGDVLLSGRAQEEAATVRVYLNNAPVTVLEVDTAGRWRGDLPDVDTGVYTLRVDEVDAEGAVTSRVETPFKREAPEVLAAAGGTENAPAKAITVQTGATLWAIARDRYGDGTLFVRVFEANSDLIKDANLIYPGQVFDLPE